MVSVLDVIAVLVLATVTNVELSRLTSKLTVPATSEPVKTAAIEYPVKSPISKTPDVTFAAAETVANIVVATIIIPLVVLD
jgi:hypothetical protein